MGNLLPLSPVLTCTWSTATSQYLAPTSDPITSLPTTPRPAVCSSVTHLSFQACCGAFFL